MIQNLFHIIELASIFYVLSKLNNKKFRLDILTIFFFASMVLIMTLINEGILPRQTMIITYIGIFAYEIIYYKQNFLEAVKIVFLMIIIVIALECLVGGMIFAIAGFLIMDSKFLEMYATLFVNSIVLLVLLITCKFIRLDKVSTWVIEKFKKYKFIAIYIVCIMLAETLWININGMVYIIPTMSLAVLLISVGIVLLMWHKEQTKMQLEVNRIKMQTVYDGTFNEMIQQIRRKQNDFDNHLNAIYSMPLTIKNYDELVKRQSEYCDKIKNNKYIKMLNENSCPTIMGFLYSKFTKAEEQNIEVSPHIVIQEAKCKASQYEIIEMIGILFDNAVDAVSNKNTEYKKIRTIMIEHKNKVEICVMNRSDFIEQREQEKFLIEGYSTKGQNRGIGLNNVKKIVNESRGTMILENIEYNNQNWFSIKIYIDM